MKYNEMLAYLEYLKETSANQSQSYKDALNDVDLVMEFIGSFERPGNNGEYPPIDEKHYNSWPLDW